MSCSGSKILRSIVLLTISSEGAWHGKRGHQRVDAHAVRLHLEGDRLGEMLKGGLGPA
jgi:hypothetical protein